MFSTRHTWLRSIPKCSRFGYALIVSTLFHLSMVTLFNIVIYFPREEIKYYQFDLVPDRAFRPLLSEDTGAPGRLRVPGIDSMLSSPEDTASLGELLPRLSDRMLPEIALPTIEFAELERLRVRQRGVASSPLYQEVFRETSSDSWGRFGQSLRRVGRAISTANVPWEDDTAVSGRLAVGDRTDVHRVPVGRPAEGFEAYIEWSTEPHDRSILYAPPIQALWQVDPVLMRRPLEVVFEVNPHGRVISVWSPGFDDAGVLDDVQSALLKYRFASVDDTSGADQLATLIIRSERRETVTP